jgi:hypothetical protein
MSKVEIFYKDHALTPELRKTFFILSKFFYIISL